MYSGSDQLYRFEIAAFKIIRGGHYILGPRSQLVTAGKGMANLSCKFNKLTSVRFCQAACPLVDDKMIKLRHNAVKVL